MSWKTQIINYGRRFAGLENRWWLGMPLMRHLRIILLAMMIIVLGLMMRIPYLLGQINQAISQNKDLVLPYSSGEYLREFDHLRVGILEQFAQEAQIIDADVLLDDHTNLQDERSITVREHLKREQSRIRQHLDNYVRLQNFEERDLQSAIAFGEQARLTIEKALTELLLWLAGLLILIMVAGKVVLADLKALFPLGRGSGAGDSVDGDATFTSLHEINRAALVAAGAEKALEESAAASLSGHPLNIPPPQGLVALASGGTAQVEILHNHETYRFFTVNFSETGVLLNGLELRPQIFTVGEELIGTLKTDTQAIYFKGQVVRVQQERQSFLYGIKFLSSAFTGDKNQ